MNKEEYIEEGINGQWTNWKFEAENYKRVCEGLYQHGLIGNPREDR